MKATTGVERLVTEDPARKGLLIYNNGSATVELLSDNTLKYGDGIPIGAGKSYDNDRSCCAYWIVAASGSQDVRVEVNSD